MSNDLYAELRRHKLLEAFISRRVVAEAVAEISLPPMAIKEAIQDFLQQQGFKDNDQLDPYLEARGQTREDFDYQISLPLKVQAYCEVNYRHKAEAHFLQRKNQLDKVVYSLLRVKDGYLAKELYLRIEAGESSFSDLAAQYAEGVERKTNGVIGPVSLTKAHPTLSEQLRIAVEGEVMQPFKLSDWWVVVRLESYTQATFDEAMANKLAYELFQTDVDEETQRIICGNSFHTVAKVKE